MNFEEQPIIAAVRSEEAFLNACKSPCTVIFLLASNILTLPEAITAAHENGKLLFLHVDLAEGIAKDAYGVRYVASLGVDGIITTRSSTVKHAKECGLRCIQRFFLVDSQSVQTALDAVRTVRPDMIELMPGTAVKTVKQIATRTSLPVIAGGLIEEKEEIFAALAAGAAAVSTGKEALWNL